VGDLLGTTDPDGDEPSGVRRLWARVARSVSWTTPTSTEIGVVAKSGLAAGLSWWIARVATDVADPVLAALTAIVVVQVSVRASVRSALQRSLAVVIGVLVALAIGDALALNGFTVAVLVAVSLGVAQLVLRLPSAAARQVPISGLLVLAAVTSSPGSYGWLRALETVLGAAVGVVVSLVLPASRLVDARQTVQRLADSVAGVLEAMGSGLQHPWSTDQTAEWRRTARAARDRQVSQAAEAVGNGQEAARWNVRDRRHLDELGRYEEILPRLERTAIGVSVISRGLDDHARLAGTTHREMPGMGSLLIGLAGAVRALARDVVGASSDGSTATEGGIGQWLGEVQRRRDRCVQAASRRARSALEHIGGPEGHELEGEWLGYAALLVQVDRIVVDLSAPLPT
jgi:uncharacterized membrane protein YgaE (UPF0421/DUF939 family)